MRFSLFALKIWLPIEWCDFATRGAQGGALASRISFSAAAKAASRPDFFFGQDLGMSLRITSFRSSSPPSSELSDDDSKLEEAFFTCLLQKKYAARKPFGGQAQDQSHQKMFFFMLEGGGILFVLLIFATCISTKIKEGSRSHIYMPKRHFKTRRFDIYFLGNIY
jgi:hypothetical protein